MKPQDKKKSNILTSIVLCILTIASCLPLLWIPHPVHILGNVPLDCDTVYTRITYDDPNSGQLGAGYYTTNRNGDWLVTEMTLVISPTTTDKVIPITRLVEDKDFAKEIGEKFTYIEPVLVEVARCENGKEYEISKLESDAFRMQNVKPQKNILDVPISISL